MSNSKKDVKIVGVDDGHSGTKIFAGYDPVTKQPIQKMIPSIVVKGETNFTNANKDDLDNATIIVDGENYTVGSKFAGTGDDLAVPDYPTSGQNVALITQALRNFLPGWGGGPIELSIVTGLPLGHYFDKLNGTINMPLVNAKKKNVERLMKSFSPADNNKPMFNLVRNSVQPEGWGSLLDDILDERGMHTERYDIVEEYGAVVIDIGGRTVDTMVVQAEVMTALYKDVHTYNLGVLNMYRELGNYIMQAEGVSTPLKRNKLEEVIRDGKYGRTAAKTRDYTAVVAKMIENHVSDIFERVKEVISSPEAEGGVIVTGGGAILFGELLKAKIEGYNDRAEVVIPVDPAFSNSRGFWKTARNVK